MTSSFEKNSMIRDDGDLETNTFAAAFEERYSDLLDDFKEPQVIGFPGADRVVEFVGMEKTTGVIKKNTTKLTLTGMNIKDVGNVSQSILNRINKVEELDLSSNRMTEWKTVAEIVSLIPSLHMLSLSKNPQLSFNSKSEGIKSPKEVFSNIKTLILANCDYSWQDVISTAIHVWPDSIESLILHGNLIQAIDTPPDGSCFQNIRFLDLSSNAIQLWSHVLAFGHLPCLQELNLSSCQLQTISFPPDSIDSNHKKTSVFQKLEKLNMSGNLIESWSDIAQFNKLIVLKDLNVKSNPVMKTQKDYETAFNLVLGRIGNLVKLNNEEVKPKLRLEAEMYYLKMAHEELVNTKANRESIEWKDKHPRFSELHQKLGLPEVSAATKPKYITVVLQTSTADTKKRLPLSTNISSLKVMGKRIFGLDATSDIQVTWKPKNNSNFECPLDDDDKTLSFYDVNDEDVILFA